MEYWPLVCTIRKKGYKKPVLSKGWRKFVLGNRLNVDDKLTFHKEEDEESGSLHYRVEVKRATRPSRIISHSPPALDHDVDETTSARSCKTVVTDDISSFHSNDVSVDMSNVMDFNHQDSRKSQSSKEQEREVRELKLFGAIIGGSLVVGTTETIDHHKKYHNSLKHFGLLDDGDSQANLIRSDSATEETAAIVLQHSNLGLTLGGSMVHVHDQAATSSTSFYKADQRLGFELDMILGQSIGDHMNVVNLDLTLKTPE
ncbi:hypothetical protein REPUB_Repub04eG0013700 [Reevesia pubescens]